MGQEQKFVIFLDANYILRLMIAPRNSREEANMFTSATLMRMIASGSRTATTSDAILGEVIYILLDPRYGLSRGEIAQKLRRFLSLKGLTSPSRVAWLDAVDIWESNTHLSYVDSLAAALCRRGGYELATFDQRLAKLQGLTLYNPD